MLPFAIIVINAVDNHTDESLLDPQKATNTFLDSLERAVHKNHNFVKWARFWRERGREIESTRDLIKAYYTDVKIVLIPEKGRPGQVHRQYRILFEQITHAARRSETKRIAARLLLTSAQFNPYLQIAYEHFSRTLEVPFDFFKASQAFTEPSQNTNPILGLIRSYLAVWPMATSQELLNKLSPLIASSIMLDVVRQQLPGKHEVHFPAYEGKLREAIRSFFDEAYPCEAVHPKFGERCTIVKATHGTKGHQLASNGKVWSGTYQSSQPPDLEEVFISNVKMGFEKWLGQVTQCEQAEGRSGVAAEKEIAFNIHRKSIIWKHCSFFRGDKKLLNHMICLCCLFKIPVHALKCGHVICDRCFEAASYKENDGAVLRLYKCPLCHQVWDTGREYVEVIPRPSTAGIRMLSLDG